MKRWLRIVLVACTAAAFAATIPGTSSQAQEILPLIVNSTGDTPDVIQGDGLCAISIPDSDLVTTCTLRAAIQEANASLILLGLQIEEALITFDIPAGDCTGPGGTCVIEPGSPYPALQRDITIDGYTQPGSGVNTDPNGFNADLRIIIDGAGAGPVADGLNVANPGVRIEGLEIRRFAVSGIEITGEDTDGTVIQGNRLGVQTFTFPPDIVPPTPGPNGFGLSITDGADNSRIGGTADSVRNQIAFNADDGVEVTGDSTENLIIGNVIHDNGDVAADLGIDLGQDGVTANDFGDPDVGPNLLQNRPDITSAVSGSTTINGTLNSTPNTTHRIEAFADDACDPSGSGEGQAFLGATSVLTDGVGNAAWQITTGLTIPPGQVITATATNQPRQETSEFSQCFTVAGQVARLNVEPETDQNAPGAQHTLTATVTDQNATPLPGVNVDFEIVSGPNANLNGNAATADLECDTIANGTCTVTYTGGANTGTDSIRSWVDSNGDDAVPGEADTTEGRDEVATPGAIGEPDSTDVVEKTWGQPCLPNQNCLEVAPETDQNATGSQHTLTATVTNSSGQPVNGVNVDFEVTSGPNTNLNGSAATADRECTTAGNGTCTVNYTGGPNTGTDLIRAWIDTNDDDVVPGEADTTEGRDESTTPGATAEPDQTDVVEKTWGPGCPPAQQCLDITPETDTNTTGATHTLTASVVNQNGPVQGVNVDFEVTAGPNANLNGNTATADLECTTAANGQCTVNYTGSATAGTDTIRGWIDANNDNAVPGEADTTEGRDEVATPGGTGEPDVTDVVEKTWVACPGAQCLDVEPETDANPVSTQHTLTATVVNNSGQPVNGVNVDFEVTAGPNANLNGNAATADLECTTAGNGTCTVNYTGSATPGTDTIRGWIDANTDNAVPGEADATEGRAEGSTPGGTAEADSTDVVEKTWGAPAAQRLEVTPETDQNPPNTVHTLTATVTDQTNTAVSGANVDFEVTAGPNQNLNGNAATADRECTTAVDGTCTVQYTVTGPGNDTIRGWIDANTDNAVPGEADVTEGQDEATSPGAVPEPDVTDVVAKVITTQGGLVCDIVGTNGDDILVGNDDRNVICGLKGDDTLRGLGGPDVLLGDGDDDELFGGDGRDLVRGGKGNDDLEGGGGGDILDMGDGNDVGHGGAGIDILKGGDGDDVLFGDEGRDKLRGGRGEDTLNGGTGTDNLGGGIGNDELNGGQGNDELRGGAGNDDLNGDAGKDKLRGGGDNDSLNGGTNIDDCGGGPGTDTEASCER